jgi:protein-S-isoprenylcysteine O-methyltransferase Ste14
MNYDTVFMSWVTLMLAYLFVGPLLIPFEHRLAYQSCSKDRAYYLSNALWWAVPLTWFLAPSAPDVWAWAAGAALFSVGATLLIWARRINPFFIPVIREPRWIVEDGPYRWLRHPGYCGFVLMAEGSFLMLGGHWVGVLPLGCLIGLLVTRARRENRILYETVWGVRWEGKTGEREAEEVSMHAAKSEFYDRSGAELP